MSDTTETATYLSDRQLARVEALKAARGVLSSQSFLSSGAVDPSPLIDVASYIITGDDPLARVPHDGAVAE